MYKTYRVYPLQNDLYCISWGVKLYSLDLYLLLKDGSRAPVFFVHTECISGGRGSTGDVLYNSAHWHLTAVVLRMTWAAGQRVGTGAHADVRDAVPLRSPDDGRRRQQQEAVEKASGREDGRWDEKAASSVAAAGNRQTEEEHLEAEADQEPDQGNELVKFL